MREVYIATLDSFLYKKISLLLPDGYIATDEEKMGEIIIWDVDTMAKIPEKIKKTVLTVSRRQGADIQRPFRLSDIEAAISTGGKKRGISVFEEEKTVSLDGVKIPLTDVEFSLFHALYRRRGEFATRAELNREVWGREGDGSLLSVYAHYLREKLEKGTERIIISSRRLGYAIDQSYFGEGDFKE